MFISNHSPFSIQHHWVWGCLHCWMSSLDTQTQRCHSNPRYCSMMRFGNPNMDTDMDIVHVIMNVHGYINVYQEFLPYPSVHHLVGLLGSPLPLLLLGEHMH